MTFKMSTIALNSLLIVLYHVAHCIPITSNDNQTYHNRNDGDNLTWYQQIPNIQENEENITRGFQTVISTDLIDPENNQFELPIDSNTTLSSIFQDTTTNVKPSNCNMTVAGNDSDTSDIDGCRNSTDSARQNVSTPHTIMYQASPTNYNGTGQTLLTDNYTYSASDVFGHRLPNSSAQALVIVVEPTYEVPNGSAQDTRPVPSLSSTTLGANATDVFPVKNQTSQATSDNQTTQPFNHERYVGDSQDVGVIDFSGGAEDGNITNHQGDLTDDRTKQSTTGHADDLRLDNNTTPLASAYQTTVTSDKPSNNTGEDLRASNRYLSTNDHSDEPGSDNQTTVTSDKPSNNTGEDLRASNRYLSTNDHSDEPGSDNQTTVTSDKPINNTGEDLRASNRYLSTNDHSDEPGSDNQTTVATTYQTTPTIDYQDIEKMLEEVVYERNPELRPGLFEGDIVLDDTEEDSLWRVGLRRDVHKKRLWTNNTVPYVISPLYEPEDYVTIYKAITTLNFMTCVKFVPWDGKTKDYLLVWPVKYPRGCWSHVGKTGGAQVVSLEPPDSRSRNCLGGEGRALHELLHALGLFHEQARADRDNFVQIHEDNIRKGYKKNFKKQSLENTTYAFEYDYNSIMHYGKYFFSKKRGKPTITPKLGKKIRLGQRRALSKTDCLKANPIRVVVTGAAGQIAYSLIYQIIKGDVFGADQPLVLLLLDIPPMMGVLEGVVMEIHDCALPLVTEVIPTDDPSVAFKDVDAAFLVGSMPRKQGMERKDLLSANVKIFKVQGEALDKHAKKNVKVLVVGNPANTNALICSKYAPSIPRENFTAMTRLDQNRGRAQVAARLGVSVGKVKNVVIWGNHSATQVPDVGSATVVVGGKAVAVRDAVKDDAWLHGDFITTIQKRGAAVIAARKMSSAMSAAKAAGDHMHDLWQGTPPGEFVSMGVISDGSYGAPKDIVFSFPVTIQDREWKIVQGLQLDQKLRPLLDATGSELLEEKAEALAVCEN